MLLILTFQNATLNNPTSNVAIPALSPSYSSVAATDGFGNSFQLVAQVKATNWRINTTQTSKTWELSEAVLYQHNLITLLSNYSKKILYMFSISIQAIVCFVGFEGLQGFVEVGGKWGGGVFVGFVGFFGFIITTKRNEDGSLVFYILYIQT